MVPRCPSVTPQPVYVTDVTCDIIELESYLIFANNMFTLLTRIISKNHVIVVIKFTCQS